jgi:hypothetical protein
MTGSAKQQTLIFLGLVMIFIIIIATSLPQMDFKPGLPLPEVENSHVVIPPGEQQPAISLSINELVRVFLILLCLGFVIFLIIKMITTIGWGYFRVYLQLLIAISCIIGSVLFLIMLLPKTQSIASMPLPLPTSTPVVRSPLGPVPPVLLWLVGIGLLISSTVLGIWIVTTYKRKTPVIDLVGREAEIAWQALMTGLDLKEVIMRCYIQMSLALAHDGGIEREKFMTTSEFEKLLETAGVPHEPIHQLTSLFEAVRYGNWQPNKKDEKKAIDSLETIMQVSKKLRSDELK